MRRYPYIVGPPVRRLDFYGRQTLINELLDNRLTCIYLVGNRRTGKTSLLHYLADQTEHIVLFLNLQSTGSTPAGMGEGLIHEIRRKARKYPVLRDLQHEVNVDICEAIERLADFAEDREIFILQAWDEAEKLLGMGRDDLECLRGAVQDKQYLRTVLTATKGLSELNDRSHSWKTSPFLFGFVTRYISPLSDEDAQDLIRQTNNPEGSVSVNDDLAKKIINHTGKHPYLIQFLCNRLYQKEGYLRDLTESDFDLNSELNNYFQIDYNILSSSERVILRRLSTRTKLSRISLEDSLGIEHFSMGSYLNNLEQLGYIYSDDGQYQIANEFLRRWLQIGNIYETHPMVSDRASREISALGKDINPSIARIYNKMMRPVGVGFLVDGNKVITCAHVVENALGGNDSQLSTHQEKIQLDFPLVEPGSIYPATILAKQSIKSEHDLACLDIDQLPQGSSPVFFATTTVQWKHKFRAFGFPDGHDDGVWVSGRILDRVANGWLQIEDTRQTGYSIQSGFSGGPIWDEKLQAVVGMVVAVERQDRLRVAFAIPISILLDFLSVINQCTE